MARGDSRMLRQHRS